MPLRFDNFKTQIPDTILKRGSDYYRKGHISDLSYDDESLWTAEVIGSEVYDVEIEQHPDGSLRWDCTCPYADDAICKHIAAVLYQIEADFLKLKKAPPKTGKPSKQESLRQTLKAMPPQTLIDILVDWSVKDRQFGDQLLLHLGVKGDKVDDYASMVKTAIRQARDSYGTISGRHAARNLEPLLSQADEKRSTQTMVAVAIYIAVIEQSTKQLENSDDENGDFYGCIESAFEGLTACVPHLDVTERKRLLEICVENQSLLTGFDWEWSFYRLAAQLVTTPQERDELFKALDDLKGQQGHNWQFSFRDETVAEIKLSVLERLNDPQAVEDFINAHADLDSFRQKLIQQALLKKDLVRAKSLAQEGLRRHQSYSPFKMVYQRLLLDIATQQRDLTQIIALHRDLWISTGEDHHYEMLKRTVTSNDWPRFFEGLKKELWGHPRLAWLHQREGEWTDLLRLVLESPQSLLTRYQTELEKRFPEEMAKFYERLAFREVENVAAGREAYKTACGYLYRMQRLGEDERVAEIVELLITQYPRRRAMIEELKQL